MKNTTKRTDLELQLVSALQLAREALLTTSSECFETGCACEGNDESKALMDVIEAAIKKAEGK